MKQPEKRRLSFSMTVDQMLAKADSFKANYATDMTALAAVDPEFTTQWGTDFQTAIDAGYSASTPETLTDQLKVLTNIRNEKLVAAATSVQELYYYVEKAVPENIEVYGRGSKYQEASRNATKMVRLMEAAQTQVGIDSAALTAKGYTAAKITAFGNALTALHTAAKNQIDKENDNLRATAVYYDTQNAVWDRLVLLNRAAMIAFQNDSEKRNQYLLYGSGVGDLVFTMTLLPHPQPKYHHLLEPLAPNQIIRFKMLTGQPNVVVAFVNADGDPAPGVGSQTITSMNEVEYVYSMFQSTGQWLRVVQDPSTNSQFRVTVPRMD